MTRTRGSTPSSRPACTCILQVFFDFEEAPFVVVSLLSPPDDLGKGVEIVRATVEKSIA